MSRSGWGNFSRGASILAALAFVAILGAIAIMVQSSVSVSVNPQSQGAQAAAPTSQAKVVCKKSGMDYKIQYDKGGVVKSIEELRKCPAGDASAGTVTNLAMGWGPSEDFLSYMKTPVYNGPTNADYFTENRNGSLSAAQRTCSSVVEKGSTVWADNKRWKCLVEVCIPKPPGQTEPECDTYAVNQGAGTGALYVKHVEARIAAEESSTADPADQKDLREKLATFYGVQNSSAITNAFNDAEQKSDGLREKLQEEVDRKNDAVQEIQEIIDGCDGKKEANCSALAKTQIEQLKKEAADAASKANNTQAQLDALQKNQVGLTAPDCDKTECKTQEEKDAFCKAKPDADRCRPSNNNDNRYNGNDNRSNGNSSFGNGSNGFPFGQQQQSTLPTSPLTGGPCTQGYICVNNTLYNQTPAPLLVSQNPIIVHTQCQVQPMQQCQYGCMQPYGAQQQTGAQSMMGGISQGIGIISNVMRLFGGGGAQQQSIMPAQNISRACATQPQNPYGTGTNGQPCTQPQPATPDPAQCTSGTWKPTSAQQNGCVTGYQCVPNGTSAGGAPTATLSCQPKVADVGMTIGFSFSCGASSASAGAGFDTKGALSGTSTAIAAAPDGATTATYTLTCVNLGVTASARCTVQVGKASIVLVASPKKVHSGENSTIGWITAGMTSCVISSPDQSDFTSRNAGITSVNGAATTSPITKNSAFYLDCQTVGGSSKQASTTIELL
ncbi:hypothetical protein HY968_03245 [Candidatus Kaiserbacteria bacterium]|nr:hypothetical protein [Candidatus Kaiserbacteria bacterium]